MMRLSKEGALKIIGIGLFIVLLLFLPSLAQLSTADAADSDQIGVRFVWVMFPSWIYFGGAIIMLILGTKYMAGGALSHPFTIMGYAMLIESFAQMASSLVVIGLIPGMVLIDQFVFGVGLLFRLSVVFSMVWIGNIFGIMRAPSKPEPSPGQTPGV